MIFGHEKSSGENVRRIGNKEKIENLVNKGDIGNKISLRKMRARPNRVNREYRENCKHKIPMK